VYSTCKHGLRGWSLSCHEALRKHGVKVIVIEPGARVAPLHHADHGHVDCFEQQLRARDLTSLAHASAVNHARLSLAWPGLLLGHGPKHALCSGSALLP